MTPALRFALHCVRARCVCTHTGRSAFDPKLPPHVFALADNVFSDLKYVCSETWNRAATALDAAFICFRLRRLWVLSLPGSWHQRTSKQMTSSAERTSTEGESSRHQRREGSDRVLRRSRTALIGCFVEGGRRTRETALATLQHLIHIRNLIEI